jgi:hypothetical protein
MVDLQKLAELKRLLVEATDFSDVFGFFMDHFGEKPELMTLGGQLRDPIFVQLLEQLGSRVVGKRSSIEQPLLLHWTEQKLIHGAFIIGDHVGSVFYFEDLEKGLAAFGSMNSQGPSQFARFSLVALPTGKKSFTVN